VIAKILFPTLLTTSNLDTEGVLFLDGMAENFKMMFTYYGPSFFEHFKPFVYELMVDTKNESK
jgi:hypothetical protein